MGYRSFLGNFVGCLAMVAAVFSGKFCRLSGYGGSGNGHRHAGGQPNAGSYGDS
eukprot:gene4165-14265_t